MDGNDKYLINRSIIVPISSLGRGRIELDMANNVVTSSGMLMSYQSLVLCILGSFEYENCCFNH